ncbi:MAG: bifunctional oligoribonuclease/PAP phosphatase NrnA [Firmicutes bacterium]|nr:bifunctional oligoribonuclease/PAP phosphatase NrnA [Bacillota bacterium]
MTGAGEWRRILDTLRDGRRFLLLLHVKPDGDSIGSSLALGRALQKLGKEAVLVCPDELPESLRFLPGSDSFVRPEAVSGPFDAAVFLDCGDLERAGPARPLADLATVRINIDHHLSNARFGDLNWIEADAAAVGEITYRLIRELGVALDRDMAYALYASLVTDTGSFAYQNTTPATHRIAAELLELGVRPQVVAREVWENRPEPALRLLGRALENLVVDPGGRLAWTRLGQEDFQRVGAGPQHAEGVVGYPRSLRGVEVAVAFIEAEPGVWRVSLRSNERVDVSRVAARFGGGGHARAAGATLSGRFEEVAPPLLDACRAALDEDGRAPA